jgi:23S rRNA (cytosine1962-C5)-methyltransferase
MGEMVRDGTDGRASHYELIDAGEGRRLERFGSLTVDRPAPGAGFPARAPERWQDAEISWDPDGGWLRTGGGSEPVEPWPVTIEGLTLELRPTASGGVGLYPEHRANLSWLEARIAERLVRRSPPAMLNLFAHTGLVTLAAARAGAAVTHVDAARGVVGWARRNAELSGLADRPIRWLVDDAAGFVAREARRGRRYDGIVLDPPSFGHARGRRWRLPDDLPDLLAACHEIAADDAFLLLTAHTTGMDGADLAALVRAAVPSPSARFDGSTLELPATSGARLDLGWSVRLTT